MKSRGGERKGVEGCGTAILAVISGWRVVVGRITGWKPVPPLLPGRFGDLPVAGWTPTGVTNGYCGAVEEIRKLLKRPGTDPSRYAHWGQSRRLQIRFAPLTAGWLSSRFTCDAPAWAGAV